MLNKEIPIFSATIDASGHLNYGFSKEVIERLEKVLSRFEGSMATNDRLREIRHVLECELRNILWENDYDHSRGW